MTEETILIIEKTAGGQEKIWYYPDKIKELLKLASRKMPGIPEQTVDTFCRNHGIGKDLAAQQLEEHYGIKMMPYAKALEREFTDMEKPPKSQMLKNKPSRYPYYSFFTKDKHFLPMAKKIIGGSDMVGDPNWERFVQSFNEAMRVGNIPFKSPPSGPRAGVTWERGEVEWESDDVLVLVLTEMRHYKDNPFIENKEWTTWEHYRDEFVEQEMQSRGYSSSPSGEFIEEEIDDFLDAVNYAEEECSLGDKEQESLGLANKAKNLF